MLGLRETALACPGRCNPTSAWVRRCRDVGVWLKLTPFVVPTDWVWPTAGIMSAPRRAARLRNASELCCRLCRRPSAARIASHRLELVKRSTALVHHCSGLFLRSMMHRVPRVRAANVAPQTADVRKDAAQERHKLGIFCRHADHTHHNKSEPFTISSVSQQLRRQCLNCLQHAVQATSAELPRRGSTLLLTPLE